MPSPILHVGAVISCPHTGRVSPVTANTRVLVDGMPALLVGDTFPVAGCAFEVPTPSGDKLQPCTRIQWTGPAARVLVNGQPVLGTTSTGLCLSAENVPQGPPTASGVQPRVMAG